MFFSAFLLACAALKSTQARESRSLDAKDALSTLLLTMHSPSTVRRHSIVTRKQPAKMQETDVIQDLLAGEIQMDDLPPYLAEILEDSGVLDEPYEGGYDDSDYDGSGKKVKLSEEEFMLQQRQKMIDMVGEDAFAAAVKAKEEGKDLSDATKKHVVTQIINNNVDIHRTERRILAERYKDFFVETSGENILDEQLAKTKTPEFEELVAKFKGKDGEEDAIEFYSKAAALLAEDGVEIEQHSLEKLKEMVEDTDVPEAIPESLPNWASNWLAENKEVA